MPRPNLILQSDFPYYVSARCFNDQWFNLPLDKVWTIMSEQLFYIYNSYDARIHSFVLMNNNFHMLISTPSSNLDVIMARFMKECSRQINNSTGRINQAFGARYSRSLIKSDIYFQHVYKYVYRNPVQAGMLSKCELYPYSSLAFLLGLKKASFPVLNDTILFNDVEKTINWLNTPTRDEDWLAVKRGVKKIKFKLARIKLSGQLNRLECEVF